MKKFIEKVRSIIFCAAMTAGVLISGGSSAFAGTLADAGSKASGKIQSEVVSALPFVLLIICVAGGLILLIRGRAGSETVKERAPWIVGGVILIIFASALSSWLIGLF